MRKLYPFTKSVHVASSMLLIIGFGLLFVAIPASGLMYANHIEHIYQIQLQSTHSLNPTPNTSVSSTITSSYAPPAKSNVTNNTTNQITPSSNVHSLNSTNSTTLSNSSVTSKSTTKVIITIPTNVKPKVTSPKSSGCDESPTSSVVINDSSLITLPTGIINSVTSATSTPRINAPQIIVNC